MGNLTYAGFGGLVTQQRAPWHRRYAAARSSAVASLLAAQKDVTQLILKWDDAQLPASLRIICFWMRLSLGAARIRELQAKHGVCSPASTIDTPRTLCGGAGE